MTIVSSYWDPTFLKVKKNIICAKDFLKRDYSAYENLSFYTGMNYYSCQCRTAWRELHQFRITFIIDLKHN